MESAVISFTYPIVTFDVDISSLVTEVSHHVDYVYCSTSYIPQRLVNRHLQLLSCVHKLRAEASRAFQTTLDCQLPNKYMQQNGHCICLRV